MADNDNLGVPMLRDNSHHHAEKYGQKFIDKTEKYQRKVSQARGGSVNETKGPPGGYDATPIPKGPPGYTVRITFHRAENLPFADVPTFSSDPYVLAVLQTNLQKRHKQDSDLQIRTPTVHRNTNPKWETVWTIAHMPSSGFHMKCRLYDEDPADHDDRLGNVHVDVNHIDDNWTGFKERRYEVKKRMGSKRAYTIRGCAALLSRRIKLGGEMFISVENLGKSEGDGGRAYTISPLPWSQHYSPLIGLIAGTKVTREGKRGRRATERYNFQAIQMQFQGPVPEHLYHRYVEFKPFVAGMFTSHTFRGRVLNHALHHQHARIYNYDGSTKYGVFEKPCLEMTKKFLDFVHYDQGGRIFTYVITLDGQMRFTETGKEFGIDMLSKHTMHSDVSIYIAFSGEFFVRRLKHPHKDKNASPDPATETALPEPDHLDEKEIEKEENQKEETKKEKIAEKESGYPPVQREHHETLAPPRDTHSSGRDSRPNLGTESRHWSFWSRRSLSFSSSTRSPAPHAEQTSETQEPSQDPTHYELIIDNDSGTYRPNAKMLGQLKKFLQHNLPGLRIATLDSQHDAERMSKLKNEQRERKKKSGKQITYMQNASMSSLSSSDEEELERRAELQDAEEPGLVKGKINKVKQLVIGGKNDSDDDVKRDNTASSPEANQDTKKNSTSTEDKASFDTATEHGEGHFVTPKPSLGHGGLKAFDVEDRPLSRGIDDELEKRGLNPLEHSSHAAIEYPGHTNGESSGGDRLSSVHHSVTTSA